MTDNKKQKPRPKFINETRAPDPNEVLKFKNDRFEGAGLTVKFVDTCKPTIDPATHFAFRTVKMTIGYGGVYNHPYHSFLEIYIDYDDFKSGIIKSIGLIDTLEIAKAYVNANKKDG